MGKWNELGRLIPKVCNVAGWKVPLPTKWGTSRTFPKAGSSVPYLRPQTLPTNWSSSCKAGQNRWLCFTTPASKERIMWKILSLKLVRLSQENHCSLLSPAKGSNAGVALTVKRKKPGCRMWNGQHFLVCKPKITFRTKFTDPKQVNMSSLKFKLNECQTHSLFFEW